MKLNIGWMGLALGGAALAGCGSDAPRQGSTNNVEFSFAALTAEGVDVATYQVVVEVLGENGEATKFQSFEVTTEKGSSGSGTRIGTCLASDEGVTHRATITLVDAKDAEGQSVIDDCEGAREQVRYFDCIDGGDARVASEFHFMCDLARGFTDFTFSVDNVFCQAKIDCPDAPLLYDSKIDDRVKTMVLGVQCSPDLSGGDDFQIPLFAEIVCDDGTGIFPDQTTGGAIDPTKNERFIAAAYTGGELISNVKYSNYAISLAPEAFEGATSCRVAFSAWPEITKDGSYVSETRRDMAVVLGTATINVGGENGVTCKDINVGPATVPAVELIAHKLENGTQALEATSFSFAGEGRTLIEPGCFEDAKKIWGPAREAALAARSEMKSYEAKILEIEKQIADLKAKHETEVEGYNAALAEINASAETIDGSKSNVDGIIGGYFPDQNNMNIEPGNGASICTTYADIIADFDADADAAAVLAAIRTFRQDTLNEAVSRIGKLDGAAADADEAYELVVGYGGEPLNAGASLANLNAALGNLVQLNKGLEADLVANAAGDLGTRLAGLADQCNLTAVAANDLGNTLADMATATADAKVGQEQGLSDANEAYGTDSTKLEDKLTATKNSSQAAADLFDAKLREATTSYQGMAENCRTTKFPVRVANGRWLGADTKLFNARSTLIGSVVSIDKAPKFADFCSIDGEFSIAFQVKNEFHSLGLYRDGKVFKGIGLAGQFADDAIGAGLDPLCGATYIGYPGKIDIRNAQ